MAANADIRHILNCFDNYVTIYETDTWLNTLTIEEIKNSFKLAKVIEDVVKNVEAKECASTFTITLNTWWANTNRKLTYDMQFFAKACDRLLEKFFQKNVPVQLLDSAVRMYTSLFEKKRFQDVLANVVLMSASYRELIDHIVVHKDEVDINLLQSSLLIKNWVKECDCGQNQKVEENVSNMLSNYKMKNSLPVLIQMLTIDEPENQTVKTIMLNSLYAKMDDRSVLSKHFWLCLFNNIDRSCLAKVCIDYGKFFKKLVEFIVYIGGMMNYEMSASSKMMWISDSSLSICPDLTYSSIVDLTKHLCSYNVDLRKSIEAHIDDARTMSNPLLWDQFLKEI